MNNNVPTIFDFKGNEVRVALLNGDVNQPYFCLRDVCDILGLTHANTSKLGLVPSGCRSMATPTNGGNQQLTFINEPNLYRVIFKSRKENAVIFQNWVFEDVLPTIRKTGSYNYIEGRRVPTNFIEALEELIVSEGIIKELKSKIEEDAPKVELCDNLLLCEETDISLSETAKLLNNYGIDIGRNRLIALLKEWGWYTKKTNEPSQKYISNGYFKVKQKYVYGLGKHVCVGRLTPKGEMALVKKLQKKSRKDCLGSMQGKLILSDDFNDC